MCGCNKNRNVGQVQAPQINPAYRPNAWGNVQRQQNNTVSPAVQVNIPVKQLESDVTIQPTVNINRRVVPTRTPYIPTRRPNMPVRSQVDVSQAPVAPTQAPAIQSRAPVIQPRAPLDPAPQLAVTKQTIAQQRYPHRPVRMPVVQNQQPNVPVRAPSQNRPNSNIRTVQLAIPSRATPVQSPVKLQPTPQTLLANRINAARRR